jgi:hypothetical protein
MPRRDPKAHRTEDRQRTVPHRIKPPPSQISADLSRQRAREPKAPTLPAGPPTFGRRQAAGSFSHAGVRGTGPRACRDSRSAGSAAALEARSRVTVRCPTARPPQSTDETLPTRQHRNLIRRAAGRGRSGQVSQVRAPGGGFRTESVRATSARRDRRCWLPSRARTPGASLTPRSRDVLLIARTTGGGGRVGPPHRRRTGPPPVRAARELGRSPGAG